MALCASRDRFRMMFLFRTRITKSSFEAVMLMSLESTEKPC